MPRASNVPAPRSVLGELPSTRVEALFACADPSQSQAFNTRLILRSSFGAYISQVSSHGTVSSGRQLFLDHCVQLSGVEDEDAAERFSMAEPLRGSIFGT